MMKKFFAVITFSVAFILNLSSQEKAKEDIAQLVAQFNVAMVDANGPVLEKLVADELSYGHSGGQIDNKSRFIDDLVKGVVDFSTANVSDQTIEVTGNNAVVRHVLKASVTNKGIKAELNLGVLMVWCRYNGKWKLLARQGYKL